MKTVNEVLAMSELELITDHARLDTRLDIKECETDAYSGELFALIDELRDAKRYDEALRVLKIATNVRDKVTAFIDQLETAKV